MLQPPPPPADQSKAQGRPRPGQATPTHRAISIIANSLTLLFGLLALSVAILPRLSAMGHEGVGYFLVIAPLCSLLTLFFFLGSRDHDKKGTARASMTGLRLLGLTAAISAVAWIAFSVLLGGR